MKNSNTRVMIFTAATFLNGCVNVLPQAPVPSDKMSLDFSGALEAGASKTSTHVLSVALPRCSDFRDTTRVVVFHQKDGAEVQDYVVGTEWADRLPVAFQGALVHSLRPLKLFKGVVYQSDAIDSEFILMTDIRRFDVTASEAGRQGIVLEVTGNLSQSAGRILVSQKTFAVKETLEEKGLKGLQNAYSHGLDQILMAIHQWIRESV